MSHDAARREEHERLIAGMTAALRRASRKARQISIEAGVPFWVMVDGKIVDLNARRKRRRRTTKSPTRRK